MGWLTGAAARLIVRSMNISEIEVNDVDGELVERALPLLPEIGKLLYLSLTRHPGAEGLSLPQVKALGFLGSHGRCSVGELAAGVGASMPSASELVDRLVERGLAERAVNPEDRRQVLVGPTAAAGKVHAELRALRAAQIRLALSRLEPAERPVFVRSLEALVAGLRLAPEGVRGDADRGGSDERRGGRAVAVGGRRPPG